MAHDDKETAERRASRRGDVAVLAVALLAVVLVPFTLTGASVTLDDVAGALRAGPTAIQWVVNGYSATFAGFMLVTGSLADRWGPRPVFGGGVALFAACGLLSAVAGDIVLLDVARSVAGAGAAATTTGASALLAARFGSDRRPRVFGAFGAAIGGGLALGPTAAGGLTDALGWRAVFAVPAVFGLVPAAAALRLPVTTTRTRVRLDLAGAATFTASLLLLVLGLVEGSDLGWGHPVVITSLAAAVVAVGAFALVEQRSDHPLLDVRAVLTPRFLGAAVAVTAAVGAFGPLLIYLPTWFRDGLGLSAAGAGALLLALTVPSLVVPLLCGWLTRWIPPRVLVLAGLALVAAGCAWLASGAAVIGPMVVTGTGIAVAQGLLDAVAIGAAPPDAAGAAVGAFNTVKLTAETVGIAAVGAALVAASGTGVAGPSLGPSLREASGVLAAVVSLAAVAVGVLMRERPGPAASRPSPESTTRVEVSP